jgi:surface protein
MYGADSFNVDVSKWNVAKVTDMGSMFNLATSFTHIWCSNDWANTISDADFGGPGKVLCCATGKFYNRTTVDCDLCPIGQYNNLTHVTNQLPLSCETCPRNTFAPIRGLPKCSNCESNQYSNASSQLCSTCPSGYQMLYKTTGTVTTCAACIPGQFQNDPGIKTCKDCPKGFFQDVKGIPYCIGCSPGQYQDQVGNETCIKCASGRRFNANIVVGISASNCVACGKGQHQSEAGSTFCLPCLTGTFQNVTGSASCNNCPIGFSNGETNEEESCTRCPKGRFQDAIKEADCKGMLYLFVKDGSVMELFGIALRIT